MAKKGFLKGLLGAVSVCIVSFLVIFFLFPGASEKYFGMSFRNGDVSKGMQESKQQLGEMIDGVKSALRSSGATERQINEIVDSLKESDVWEQIKSGAVNGSDAVASFVKQQASKVNVDVAVDNIKSAISKVDFQKLAKNISSFASSTIKTIMGKLD